MIENLKQEISHLSLQPLEALRCLKMWEVLSRKRRSLTRVLKCLLVYTGPKVLYYHRYVDDIVCCFKNSDNACLFFKVAENSFQYFPRFRV